MKTTLSFIFACIITMPLLTAQVVIADKQFESHQYLSALQSYLATGHGNNYSEHVCLQIARCYKNLGLSENADTWYTKSASLHDLPGEYKLEAGQIKMKIGDYVGAKVLFNEYSTIDQKTSMHYINMVENAKNILAIGNTHDKVEGLQVNKATNEFAPFIHNGQLYFTTPINNITLDIDAKKQQIADNGMVVSDENFTALLKGIFTKTNISPMSISENKNIVYASNSQIGMAFNERRINNTLYIGQLDKHKIINAKPLPFNKIGYSITDPFITADGKTIYFSSNMEGGFGGYDIYYTTLEHNGQWSTPINCGAEINTIGNEVTPFQKDNYLYFASDYHYGLGGYDIFMSQYFAGDWMPITNMGLGINSSENDYYPYISAENTMYFTSTRRFGFGGEDIYKVKLNSREISGEFNQDIIENSIATQVSDTENTTVEVYQVEEKDIPKAVYIGEYLPRKEITSIETIPSLQVNSSIKTTAKFDISSGLKLKYVESQDVAALTPPPAFKIPEFRSQKATSATAVSLSEARLVSINEIITKPVNSVYFVQLAAFYSSPGELSSFAKLSSLGNIYKVFVGTATKIRLGFFNSHSEASEILQRVKSLGFKDAFLVNDNLDTRNMELVYSTYDNITSQETDNTSTKDIDHSSIENSNNFEYSKPIVPSGTQYKVRLASYEDPIWFESSKIKDIGRLEQWSKGSWTIFILSGFSSYEEAEQARIKAVNRGYADAEVVIDNNGIIERLKKN